MADTCFLSPCLSCTRVKNPKACNNKNCAEWRAWFTGRWEGLRQQVRADMDRLPQVPVGISVGGRRYLPPHRIREYLQQDPCVRCPCNRELCTVPCRVRRAWAEARKEVTL